MRKIINSSALANAISRMRQYLEDNGIDRVYHFTDIRNMDSINKCNHLYSWDHCLKQGIDIPYPGGNSSSRDYDRNYGLQDYVRLSFCDDHPMMWRLKKQGYQLVLLEFSLDIFGQSPFGFCNKNATAIDHKVGFGVKGLNLVNLDATQRHYVSNDDPEFGFHQAEILIKRSVSLDSMIRYYKV